jgi:hypothetical protein
MAEEIVQYQRQAPFIEERAEKLLASIFGTPAQGVEGEEGYQAAVKGLADLPTTVPAYEVAGLSPQQQKAISTAMSGLGAYQPALEAARTTIGTGLETLGAAQQTLDPSQISTFMDPYQQQVTQEALKEFQRQADIQAQRTSAEALAAGAFGGGRFGVREAEEARNLAQVKSQRIFEDLSRNYLQAQQAQRQTAQQLGTLGSQTLQAAQAQAGLGQLGQQLGGEDINRLLGLGQLTQQFGYMGEDDTFVPGQAQLEAARATSLAQQKEPYERMAFASDILRGVPSSQISYTQVPQPSAMQQIAGLGIAGLGAYGAATGGLGGISSLFGL